MLKTALVAVAVFPALIGRRAAHCAKCAVTGVLFQPFAFGAGSPAR